MRIFLLFTLFGMMISGGIVRAQAGFKAAQMKYARVRQAAQSKGNSVDLALQKAGIRKKDMEVFLRVFKWDQTLEVWCRNGKAGEFVHVKDFTFCALSGEPGPKCRQGDGQTPEGFYVIDRFNPYSNYFLSLGISYPNAADRKRLAGEDPGGDIFIHGKCVTIGCIPLEDEGISELYLLAMEARNNGQSAIPVHIFPTRLDEKGWDKLNLHYGKDPEKISFWKNLQPGFDRFEKEKKIPVAETDGKGKYVFR